jgi:hypothetical protein
VTWTHFHQGGLLDVAISLWVAARLIETPWQHCGSDTLGTKPVTDPKNPWFGQMMLPPIIDTQLDQIIIQEILSPLRSKVLELLETRINQHRREDWHDTYLSVFTLLHHFAMCAKHGRRFVKAFGLPVCSTQFYCLPPRSSQLSKVA